MTNKNKKDSPVANMDMVPSSNRFADAANGLFYISETDAEILPFNGGEAKSVTAAEILRQTARAADGPVEEIDPSAFFERLTTIKDWFGEPEKARAARFAVLFTELKSGLTDLHVFRIGQIRIDIYIVGLDADGRLAGVQTMAVET